MYCDLWPQYIQVRKLFKGGNYSRKYGIRNYTQILENLRNAIVGFFGLRKEFASVQGNKKRNTQNIQIKKQKKTNDVELLFVNKQKRSQS